MGAIWDFLDLLKVSRGCVEPCNAFVVVLS